MIEFDPETDRYHVDVDGDVGSISMLVVSAVAELAEVDPLDLPQLHTAIDPESLDSLFEPWDDAEARTDGHVVFTYADHEVCVDASGGVEIRQP